MNSNIEKSDKTSFVKISEQPSLYSDLEKKSVREILEDINTEDQKVALAVQKAIPQIEKLVTQIVPRMKQGDASSTWGPEPADASGFSMLQRSLPLSGCLPH